MKIIGSRSKQREHDLCLFHRFFGSVWISFCFVFIEMDALGGGHV